MAVKTENRPPQPRLSLEVTTRCNSACRHCFVRGRKSEPADLAAGLARQIIAEGFEAGYRHLHITGGEPLMWNALFKTLDDAYDMGYETVFLNSNGTLLDKKTCRRLSAYENLSVSISLEGSRALHERMRGIGSYRPAVRGMAQAISAGIETVIFATVPKPLLPLLADFVDGLYRQFPDIAYLTLIRLIPAGGSKPALSAERLEPEDFLQWVRIVSLLNLYGHRTLVLNDPLVNLAAGIMAMPWIPMSPPLHRKGAFFVTASRRMTLSHACREHFGVYAPGSIRNVLDSDGYRQSVAPDETTCPSCRYMRTCRENAMVQPCDAWAEGAGAAPFCRQVLAKIAPD